MVSIHNSKTLTNTLSSGQKYFWVNNFEMGVWPHPLTGGCAHLLEAFSTGSISPWLHILAKAIPVGSWEPLAFLASGAF